MRTAQFEHDVGHITRAVVAAVAVVCTVISGIPCPNAGASPVWRILDGRRIPDPPLDNLLFGIACPASNSCVAVGYNGNSTFQGTLVETMSRGIWRVTPSPMAGSPYLIDSLNAVSCVSARTCTAVGSATNQMGTKGRTLVETLSHGTWRVNPGPNLRAALSTLSGASCPSPNGCVAVGDAGTPSSQQTLVERQTDGTWRLMPSPDASAPYVVNYLNAVSCLSPTHCVAVGFAADATGMDSRTVIETLDGNTWRMAQSPNTMWPLNELFGIRCTTSTACVAVGDFGSAGAQKTLVETLSGDTWTITPSPNTALPLNDFFYAWCRSRTSCAAVGYAMNSSGTETRTLVATLNGGTWTIIPTPNTRSPLNELYGYSCATSGSCYAVGVSGTDNAQTALVEAS